MAKPQLHVEEVARILGISRALAYRMIQHGQLPHTRIGTRRVVVDPDELEEYMRLRRLTAEQAAVRAAEAADTYR